LLDAARVLLAEGIAVDTLIEMRHAGADHVALRAKVMAAAKLRVLEGQRDTIRFARWSAFEGFNLPTRAGKDFVNGAGPGTVRGSSPSTSVVPLSNQVTTLNHKRFKGFKMFSDGH
jgi:hypothetical protein